MTSGGGNENPYLGSRFGGFREMHFRAAEEGGRALHRVRQERFGGARQAWISRSAGDARLVRRLCRARLPVRPPPAPQAHRRTEAHRRRPPPLAREAGRGHDGGALGHPARKGLFAEWIDELAPGERRVRAKGSTYADGRKIDVGLATLSWTVP